MDKERDYIHFAYGAILLAVGLIVIAVVFLFRSEAQDITLDITNVAPTISNVKMCLGSTASDNASISGCSSISNVNLTANSTTDLSLFFQASDSNGVDDLGSTATGVYYLSTTTSGCTADNNDCYRDDATCQKITPTIDGTDAWYRCDMAVEYYALHSVGAPVWNAYVGVLDQGSLLTTSDAYLNEITYLVAGTFPTVDFGSLALGYTSTAGDNIQTAHQNLGNTVADIRVSMSNTDTNEEIDCDLGGIPDSNVKFDYDDLNGDVGYASAGVTLESQGVGYSDLNLDLAVRTNDSSPEGPNNPAQAGDDIEYIYWNITVPTSGVGGTCTEELIATYLQG